MFKSAWDFLNNHECFSEIIEIGLNKYRINKFSECLIIDVVKVDPNTETINDDDRLNTCTQVWLECGTYDKDTKIHDIRLDCGANTFEEAIIQLAELVKKHYGGN